MRLLALLIAVLLFTFSLSAQETIISDSGRVEVRYFNTSSIHEYKADRDFNYERVTGKAASAWDRFWTWFWFKVNNLMSDKDSGGVINASLFILAAAFLVYVILKITGMNRVSLFGGKNTTEKLGYQVTDENIHSISFEEMIDKAVNEGNYRLAIRLLYLQTLKKLTDRHLIDWRINKTNIAYLKELENTMYHAEFSRLTFAFENNWYGDQHVNDEVFFELRKGFGQFNQQL